MAHAKHMRQTAGNRTRAIAAGVLATAGALVAVPVPARATTPSLPAVAPVAAPVVKPASAPATYTVRPGDTLSGIASAHGISPWSTLYEANRSVIGTDPDRIYPGQRYTLPDGATSAPAAKPAPAPATTPKPAPKPAPAAVSGKADAAVAYAIAHISSAAYLWGGAGPTRFDCSGLTMKSWAAAGVGIPHNAKAQLNSLTRVSLSAIRPGDLVVWSFSSYADHVSIYVGKRGPNGADLVDTASSHANGGVGWSTLATRGGTVAGVVRPG